MICTDPEAPTRTIDLGKGLSVLVDAADYAWLSQRTWRAVGRRAVRYETDGEGAQRTIVMAREIVNAPAGLVVDHINGDTLDNRRANLRLCTHAENMRNRRKHLGGARPYKGVEKSRGRWRARLRCNGVRYCSRSFATPQEAAVEYNRMALLHHGEFARLNEL